MCRCITGTEIIKSERSIGGGTGGIGGVSRERKEGVEESRHAGDSRRHREQTEDTKWKRGNTK